MANKTTIFSELVNGTPGGYVTDVSQVRGAASSLVTQTINLASGWNWVSFYVDVTMEDLQTALGSNGVQIKDLNSFTDYGTNSAGVTKWWGDLDEISKTSMYMIKVSADCTIQLTGKLLNPEEVPITLAANTETWISFISDKEMSLNDAMSNLTPIDGDQVKGHNGFSQYYTSLGMWWGTLETLEPGKGYTYVNKAAEDRTLTYPTETDIKIQKAVATKQDALVSGTNIKTVNGESILGEGDIAIEAGSSAYPLTDHGTADTTFELTPNVFHLWGEVTKLNLTLGTATEGIVNEYIFQFTSGSTATTLTIPKFAWANGDNPTIAVNTVYKISIVNRCATYLAFPI